MSEVTQVFTQLLQNARKNAETVGNSWFSYADPELESPCQYGDVSADQQVRWWPVLRSECQDFSNLEHGLEISLHTDLQAFYGHCYGGGLKVKHSRGNAELLMVWHQEDFSRLQQNIIAHILMKRRLKQRETVFFAVTDDDDIMLSVLNETGAVYIEHAGCEVKELLATSLAEFLQQLTVAE
jgi:SecY interacting protein Syd